MLNAQNITVLKAVIDDFKCDPVGQPDPTIDPSLVSLVYDVGRAGLLSPDIYVAQWNITPVLTTEIALSSTTPTFQFGTNPSATTTFRRINSLVLTLDAGTTGAYWSIGGKTLTTSDYYEQFKEGFNATFPAYLNAPLKQLIFPPSIDVHFVVGAVGVGASGTLQLYLESSKGGPFTR